jgi:hypothetical protein
VVYIQESYIFLDLTLRTGSPHFSCGLHYLRHAFFHTCFVATNLVIEHTNQPGIAMMCLIDPVECSLGSASAAAVVYDGSLIENDESWDRGILEHPVLDRKHLTRKADS